MSSAHARREVASRSRLTGRLDGVLAWVAGCELPLALALTPILLSAPPFGLAVALLVPVIWAACAAMHPTRTPLDVPLLFFIALLPPCLLITLDGSRALPMLLGLVAGVALFRALARAQEQPLRDGRAVAIAAAGVALIGLLMADWVGGKLLPLDTMYALLPRIVPIPLPGSARGGINPNEVAGALVLLLPGAVVATVDSRPSPPMRAVIAGCAVIAVAVLTLTQSRLGYLGAACGLLALVAGWRTRRVRVRRAVLALALIVPALGELSLPPSSLFLAPTPAGARPVTTLDVRLVMWDRGLSMLRDAPWSGVGPGQFTEVLHTSYASEVIPRGTEWAVHAHNFALQAALDYGIPAAAAFFVLLAMALAHLSRLAACGRPQERLLALGLLGGWVGFLAYGIGDAVMLGSRGGILLWGMLGMGEALWLTSSLASNRSQPRNRALASGLAAGMGASAPGPCESGVAPARVRAAPDRADERSMGADSVPGGVRRSVPLRPVRA
jgi:O-antigen ligase